MQISALAVATIASAICYMTRAWESFGIVFTPVDWVERWLWPNRWTFYTPHASIVVGVPVWFSVSARFIWLTLFFWGLWLLVQSGVKQIKHRARG